jgi:glycerate kinase
MGKAPIGVACIAKKYGKTAIAFAGCIGAGAAECNSCGIDAYFPIVRQPVTSEQAMDPDNARKNLSDTAEQVFRMIKAGHAF